jgi:hypothetical protein
MRQDAGSRYTRNAANQLGFLASEVLVDAGLVVSFMPLFSGFHKETLSCSPNVLFYTVVLAALAA